MEAETITAIAELLWPVLAAVLLIFLLPTIERLATSKSFSIKVGQFEISIQEASEQIQNQIEDLQTQVQALEKALSALSPLAGRAAVQRFAPPVPSTVRSILWVADEPQKNAHELAKLQNEGWEVSTARSTDEALDYLQKRTTPTVIVSGMARREGLTYRQSAGLDLIREARSRNIATPIIIYTTRRAEDREREVQELGGTGITSSPIELFRILEETAV